MEYILAFFSDLILLTAGLGVLVFWVVLIVAVSIEGYDMITGKNQDEDTDNEEEYN